VSDHEQFLSERAVLQQRMQEDSLVRNLGVEFIEKTLDYKYSYNFDWLGMPIIQFPQDILAFQEVVWQVKPDLIVETGVARGGSILYSSSLMHLLDKCHPLSWPRKVIGIDIDIRPHNRLRIEEHPLSTNVTLIEGSSIDPSTFEQVKQISSPYKKIIVCLDSNHTHQHVLEELILYSQLVSIDSYCIVYDTITEMLPPEKYHAAKWAPGNSPLTAVKEFMSEREDFIVDNQIYDKLLISVAPQGHLKRIK